MLAAPIWSCLSYDRKLSLMFYQRANHDKHWMPPEEKQEPTIKVHYDHAEDVDRIMQATPEQVKHNQGVFKE